MWVKRYSKGIFSFILWTLYWQCMRISSKISLVMGKVFRDRMTHTWSSCMYKKDGSTKGPVLITTKLCPKNWNGPSFCDCRITRKIDPVINFCWCCFWISLSQAEILAKSTNRRFCFCAAILFLTWCQVQILSLEYLLLLAIYKL